MLPLAAAGEGTSADSAGAMASAAASAPFIDPKASPGPHSQYIL